MTSTLKAPRTILLVLFYMFLAIPLLYISTGPATTRALRYTALLGIPLFALTLSEPRRAFTDNLRKLDTVTRICLGVFVVTGLASCVKRLHDPLNTIVGSSPDYLGLLTWIVFLIIGILFAKTIRQKLFSPGALAIGCVILIISLLFDTFYIKHGLRVAGVFFQPTTMGMYATLVAVLSYRQLVQKIIWMRILGSTTLLLATSVVILSQSRVAYLLLLLASAALASKYLRKHVRLLWVPLSIIILLAVIPILHLDYFSRLQADSIDRGTVYRLDLYKVAGRDVLEHNVLLGNGANTLPRAINDQNQVPEEIAQSLDLGYTFASSHNLFFDLSYYFGIINAVSVVYLLYRSFKNNRLLAKDIRIEYILVLTVLAANASVNIPSLELTSLLFLTLFGLLTAGSPRKLKHAS